MEDQIVEAWTIHDRINLYLLDAITDQALDARLNPKFRSVRQLLAHIHNVRLLWLKSASPKLLEGLSKLEGQTEDTATLASSLKASGLAIASLLRESLLPNGRVKGFKPHPPAFLAYLISHESHHRGQIGWTLKATGQPLSQKTAFGLWEWGVR